MIKPFMCIFAIDVLLSFLFHVSSGHQKVNYEIRYPELEEPDDVEFFIDNWRDVSITVYNPVESQCDDTPFVTSCNYMITERSTDWCAVSRDLLEVFHYGDSIEVFISEGHPMNGKWLVADTMNKRYTNSIDLLCFDRSLGKWQGMIR